MSRVSEILVRIRDSLSDNDKTRWSDSRLIRLIDEAQKDLVVEAQMLRTKVDIAIQGDKATYELPTDAYFVTRAKTLENGRITIMSHNEMDDLPNIPDTWEEKTGTEIEAVIFDKQNPRFIKVYPIPIDSDSLGDTFTLSDYGVTTAVEGDLVVPDYGVVADISGSASDTSSFSSDYGIMTDMVSVIASLTIYYRRIPLDIADINDVPEIEPIWDKALRYYAIALALADDQDTQNVAMSDKYMGLYLREQGRAVAVTSKNNTSNAVREDRYHKAI